MTLCYTRVCFSMTNRLMCPPLKTLIYRYDFNKNKEKCILLATVIVLLTFLSVNFSKKIWVTSLHSNRNELLSIYTYSEYNLKDALLTSDLTSLSIELERAWQKLCTL